MAKESRTSEVERIGELIARSERLWLARDLDAYMALHDDQVVLLWPNRAAPIIGAKAARSWYEDVLGRIEYIEVHHDIRETEVAGPWAFMWSLNSGAAIVKASGERSEFRVKSLYILCRQADGPWRIARLIMSF
jgi:ketosteroid isomerase-like protein